jgi:polysaccharide export outer membrane protein
MAKNKRFFVIPVLAATILLLLALGSRSAFPLGVEPPDEEDKAIREELENNAKYAYYIGEYYYSQGRYQAAEPYFRRSRDLMERGHEIVSERREKPNAKGAISGSSQLYRIGEGDTLRISVWQNDDLTQDVIVRPDGAISFPLIGDVPALGLTFEQLKVSLTEHLGEFIKSPVISITLKRLGESKVIVLGQVGYPGVYAVSGKRTVLEAIALAGGFTNDAVVSSVVLIRGGLEKPQGKRLSLNKALSGKGNSSNVFLQSEDIIFVPKKFISDINYLVNTILGPLVEGAFNVETSRYKRW